MQESYHLIVLLFLVVMPPTLMILTQLMASNIIKETEKEDSMNIQVLSFMYVYVLVYIYIVVYIRM